MDSKTAIQILARIALCIGMTIPLAALTFEAASAASKSPAAATKGKSGASAIHAATSADEENEEDTEDTEDDEDTEDRDNNRRAADLPINGWWWAPSQPGRGYSIEIRRGHLFLGAYTYDSQGQAVWVVSSEKMRTPTTYRGEFEYHRNGPTLTSRATRSALSSASSSGDRDDDDDDDDDDSGPGSDGESESSRNGSAGIVEITFTSPTTATLTWAGTPVEIERFSIVAGGAATDWDAETSNRPSTGWYWDSSRAGSGFFAEMQGESLFLVAFFYRTDGSPVWYVAMQGLVPGSSSSRLTFTGSLYEYASAASTGTTTGSTASVDVTTPTDAPAAYAFAEIGTVTVQFRGKGRATITMPDGDVISVTRFRF